VNEKALSKRGAKIQKKEDICLLLIVENAKGHKLFSAQAFVRNRQFLSALRSAGSQHAATIGRGHSFSETVFVSASFVRGLISSFHFFICFFCLLF
jgi:hypothetical protein